MPRERNRRPWGMFQRDRKQPFHAGTVAAGCMQICESLFWQAGEPLVALRFEWFTSMRERRSVAPGDRPWAQNGTHRCKTCPLKKISNS